MNTKSITGAIKIACGGHKGTGVFDRKTNTWHAEWFKGVMFEAVEVKAADGSVTKQGHSYEFNLEDRWCNVIANKPMGTTFTVELSPRMRTTDEGTLVEDVTLGDKTGILYHKMNVENINVAKVGSLELAAEDRVYYMADVEPTADPKKAEAAAKGAEDDE